MSADLLRRAAGKLRAATAKTSPGPWTVTANRLGAMNTIDSATHIVARTWPCDSHPRAVDADGQFIALMHPPVAVAIAAWLEGVARHAEKVGDGFQPGAAVEAIARAILREDQ